MPRESLSGQPTQVAIYLPSGIGTRGGMRNPLASVIHRIRRPWRTGGSLPAARKRVTGAASEGRLMR